MNQYFTLFQNVFFFKLIVTVIALLAVMGLRFFIVRSLKKKESLPLMHRRRYIVMVQNFSLLLVLVLLVVIWMEEMRTIVASLMLFAAAIVVATKELITNISGFFFRSSTNFISIGDRIEISGIRGDVVDQSVLGLTLLEVGPGAKTNQYTGLTAFVPNSNLLATPVKNETHMWGDFVFHLITIPLKIDTNWHRYEEALLQAANESCAGYLDEARKNMESLAAKYSLDTPTVEPKVSIQITEPEKASLVLRIPVPAKKRGRLEQEISKRYLMIVQEMNKAEETVEVRATPEDPAHAATPRD